MLAAIAINHLSQGNKRNALVGPVIDAAPERLICDVCRAHAATWLFSIAGRATSLPCRRRSWSGLPAVVVDGEYLAQRLAGQRRLPARPSWPRAVRAVRGLRSGRRVSTVGAGRAFPIPDPWCTPRRPSSAKRIQLTPALGTPRPGQPPQPWKVRWCPLCRRC